MKFTIEEISFINEEIKILPRYHNSEIQDFLTLHPGLDSSRSNGENSPTTIFFHTNNTKLSIFLCEKFNCPLEDLYSMHKIEYQTGWGSKRHKDTDFYQSLYIYKTVLILLSDNFMGGETYVNDEIVEMNKRGNYVEFNGSDTWHEVKDLKSGCREVLVLWFSKNKKRKYPNKKFKSSII